MKRARGSERFRPRANDRGRLDPDAHIAPAIWTPIARSIAQTMIRRWLWAQPSDLYSRR